MASLRFLALCWPFTLLCWIQQLWHGQFPVPLGILTTSSIGSIGSTIGTSRLRRESNPKSPIHLHLSLTDEPSQVLIQFTTISEGVPVAMYGCKGKGDEQKVLGTSTTFSWKDLCQASSSTTTPNKSPGHFHTVLLSNLQPDTRYQYQVGITVGQGIIWSESIASFQSPPLVAQNESLYSFLVLSNQGTIDAKESVNAIAKLVDSHSIHAIHHLGGLSYARGNITMWDEWFQMIQVYASKVPLMIVVGSTEYDYLSGTGDPSGVNKSYTPIWGNYGNNDSGGECGVVVAKRFQMPRGGNGVFWYRHEAPLLTTLVLSSEHDLSPSSPQYQWLQDQLQDHHLHPDKWIVLEIHRPLYMNQAIWSDNNVGLGLRRSIEPLLRHKVHLVLSGHYQAYFRSCPGLFQSQCHHGGPTHITLASAGRVFPPPPPQQQQQQSTVDNNATNYAAWYPASWAAKTMDDSTGFGRVVVHNRSTLEFQWITLQQEQLNHENDLEDHVWLTK